MLHVTSTTHSMLCYCLTLNGPHKPFLVVNNVFRSSFKASRPTIQERTARGDSKKFRICFMSVHLEPHHGKKVEKERGTL